MTIFELFHLVMNPLVLLALVAVTGGVGVSRRGRGAADRKRCLFVITRRRWPPIILVFASVLVVWDLAVAITDLTMMAGPMVRS